MITDGQIKQLAVSCGFKLTNETGDDLKPYVYEFASELIALAQQVKPLEFFIGDDGRETAETPFGTYRVNHTLAEAIEAANADYRKWVLSCLVHGGV